MPESWQKRYKRELKELDIEEILDLVFSYQTPIKYHKKKMVNQELVQRLIAANILPITDW